MVDNEYEVSVKVSVKRCCVTHEVPANSTAVSVRNERGGQAAKSERHNYQELHSKVAKKTHLQTRSSEAIAKHGRRFRTQYTAEHDKLRFLLHPLRLLDLDLPLKTAVLVLEEIERRRPLFVPGIHSAEVLLHGSI